MLTLLVVTIALAIVTILHGFMQANYASRWRKKFEVRPETSKVFPYVLLIITCHNEPVDSFLRCLQSIRCLDYPKKKLQVVVVDDGSSNQAELESVYGEIRESNWIVICQEHAGKRKAQDAGLRRVPESDYVLFVDSDTVVHQLALRYLVSAMDKQGRVGAVSGLITVQNSQSTWLTRLLVERYHMLFARERVAQSYFGAMMCCAGPLTLYKRKVLKEVWYSYQNQQYKGKTGITGDDNWLAQLIQGRSYKTICHPLAVGETDVPSALREYFSQQVRWSRSIFQYWKGTWRLAVLHRSWYLKLDVLMQLYPLLLVGLPLILGRGNLLWTLNTFVTMAVIRALSLLYTSDFPCWERLRFILLYGAIHLFLLIPARVYALFTLQNNGWGTRGSKK